jgi:hypothetical protein
VPWQTGRYRNFRLGSTQVAPRTNASLWHTTLRRLPSGPWSNRCLPWREAEVLAPANVGCLPQLWAITTGGFSHRFLHCGAMPSSALRQNRQACGKISSDLVQRETFSRRLVEATSLPFPHLLLATLGSRCPQLGLHPSGVWFMDSRGIARKDLVYSISPARGKGYRQVACLPTFA